MIISYYYYHYHTIIITILTVLNMGTITIIITDTIMITTSIITIAHRPALYIADVGPPPCESQAQPHPRQGQVPGAWQFAPYPSCTPPACPSCTPRAHQ